MISFKTKNIINDLDWNCADQFQLNNSLSILHWYPASFISAIPGNLIDILSVEGQIVWDPFCGSGSTGVEAFRKGRYFIGNDICPLSKYATLSKLYILKYLDEFNSDSTRIINKIINRIAENKFSLKRANSCCELKVNHELAKWYNRNVFVDLCDLHNLLISHQCSEKLQFVYTTIFLNTARVATSQQKTWGHIADNVVPSGEQHASRSFSPHAFFINRVNQILKRAKKNFIHQTSSSFEFYLCCSKNIKLNKKADIVVTSPPYPSMCDYVTSQRLGLYWLNYSREDIDNLKRIEIGARYRRHSSVKNSLYLSQMMDSFDNIVDNVNPGGYISIIMPYYEDSDPRKRIIDDFYAYLESKTYKILSIKRDVDDFFRWAPFKKLKKEELTIWNVEK